MIRSSGIFVLFLLAAIQSGFAETTAPSLIQNGNFAELGSDGKPLHWFCLCRAEGISCAVKQAEHGSDNSYVIPSGCEAEAGFSSSDPAHGVRFELSAKTDSLNLRSFSIMTLGNEVRETEYADVALPDAESGWFDVHSSPVSMVESNGRGAVIITNLGTEDLEISAVQALQDVPNPEEKSGSLVHAVHRTELAYLPGTQPTRLWFPLPLDFATQVPLSFNLSVSPQSVVKKISYVLDEHGNWGAYVDLLEDQSASHLDVRWDSIVLSERIDDSEKPILYAATEDPSIWLASTEVVNAKYPGIASTATQLSDHLSSPLDKMSAVIGWTSKNLSGNGDVTPGLDAVTVFNDRFASCTGYANLAAALGRASGVPTRVLANLLVGMPQETHYIDEFYLGKDLGWRRVEPQRPTPFVPEDYSVAMRFVLPENEGAEAFSQPDWVIKGVPWLSLAERISGADRITRSYYEPAFADCPFCENEATIYTTLRGSREEMKPVFDLARKTWQRDFHAILNNSIDPEILERRERANDIKNVDDLRAFVESLKATQTNR